MQNCYKAGRTPREIVYHENGNTHEIATDSPEKLTFLQDIVSENKLLKARVEELEASQSERSTLHSLAAESTERIQQIQEQYLRRADEINAMMMEKHKIEIMKQVEERLEAEKNAYQQIVQLREAIEELKKQNVFLNEQLTARSVSQDELQDLKERFTQTILEMEQMKSKQASLESEKATQFGEIQLLQNLKLTNHELTQELKQANQKNRELDLRLGRLDKEIREIKKDRSESETEDELRTRLFHLEKMNANSSEREKSYESLVNELKSEIEKLKTYVNLAETDYRTLKVEFDSILDELVSLKKKYSTASDKQTFKEFVVLKREVVALREDNERLRKLKNLRPGSTSSVFSTKSESAHDMKMLAGRKDIIKRYPSSSLSSSALKY